MAETTVKELIPLIHHVPFVLVFVFAAVVAVRGRETSPRRKGLLLIGLAVLLLERGVAVWLYFADLTIAPPEDAMIVARRISTVIYLDWCLSVVGVLLVILAALLREDARSQGVMPNTSLERTRER
jgi:uncharacterized membrane protein